MPKDRQHCPRPRRRRDYSDDDSAIDDHRYASIRAVHHRSSRSPTHRHASREHRDASEDSSSGGSWHRIGGRRRRKCAQNENAADVQAVSRRPRSRYAAHAYDRSSSNSSSSSSRKPHRRRRRSKRSTPSSRQYDLTSSSSGEATRHRRDQRRSKVESIPHNDSYDVETRTSKRKPRQQPSERGQSSKRVDRDLSRSSTGSSASTDFRNLQAEALRRDIVHRTVAAFEGDDVSASASATRGGWSPRRRVTEKEEDDWSPSPKNTKRTDTSQPRRLPGRRYAPGSRGRESQVPRSHRSSSSSSSSPFSLSPELSGSESPSSSSSSDDNTRSRPTVPQLLGQDARGKASSPVQVRNQMGQRTGDNVGRPVSTIRFSVVYRPLRGVDDRVYVCGSLPELGGGLVPERVLTNGVPLELDPDAREWKDYWESAPVAIVSAQPGERIYYRYYVLRFPVNGGDSGDDPIGSGSKRLADTVAATRRGGGRRPPATLVTSETFLRTGSKAGHGGRCLTVPMPQVNSRMTDTQRHRRCQFIQVDAKFGDLSLPGRLRMVDLEHGSESDESCGF